jgi:hypothetical protein
MNHETICDPVPGAEVNGFNFFRDQNGSVIARCCLCLIRFDVMAENAATGSNQGWLIRLRKMCSNISERRREFKRTIRHSFKIYRKGLKNPRINRLSPRSTCAHPNYQLARMELDRAASASGPWTWQTEV